MTAKRKQFICKKCLRSSTKTISSHNGQFKRLGYVLCTECSLSRNAVRTSQRLKAKYAEMPKNRDIVTIECIDCGKPKTVQRRAVRNGYLRCKSCAAKLSRLVNKTTYDKASRDRVGNESFANAVSVGVCSIPKCVRVEKAKKASLKLWAERGDELRERRKHQRYKDAMAVVAQKNALTTEEFIQTPSDHLQGCGCQKCAIDTSTSAVQSQITEFVGSIYGGEMVVNDRTTIGPKELDIFLPDCNLAIEVHGVFWHSFPSSESKKQIYKHYDKSDAAEVKNITLLQLFDFEWFNYNALLRSMIGHKLGLSTRVGARKCVVSDMNSDDARRFFNKNHIQGHRAARLYRGLIFNDEIVAAVAISRHNKYKFELIRYANKIGTSVVGGLGKLLKPLRLPNLLSYADRRFSSGGVYRALGFKHIGITKPGYWYIKNDIMHSRYLFQKHKLKNRIDVFDRSLSEANNMFANNYRRLWDAGHHKFVL